MTPEQMQARSRAKVKQVMDLMKLLQVTVEPREHITRDGFIEKTLFWSDNEKYPEAPVEDKSAGAEEAQSEEEVPEAAPEAPETPSEVTEPHAEETTP